MTSSSSTLMNLAQALAYHKMYVPSAFAPIFFLPTLCANYIRSFNVCRKCLHQFSNFNFVTVLQRNNIRTWASNEKSEDLHLHWYNIFLKSLNKVYRKFKVGIIKISIIYIYIYITFSMNINLRWSRSNSQTFLLWEKARGSPPSNEKMCGCRL
jgi:hypothetical protein